MGSAAAVLLAGLDDLVAATGRLTAFARIAGALVALVRGAKRAVTASLNLGPALALL